MMKKPIDEDEERFIRKVDELYRLSTGHELAEWEKRYLLSGYHFKKQHPLAKIVMGRNGPRFINMEKER